MDINNSILIHEKCRLCLDKIGVVNIFEEDLTGDILLYTGIKISQSDKLPRMICASCAQIINNAKQLRTLAKKNDSHLKQLFGTESNGSSENNTDINWKSNSITVRKDLFEPSPVTSSSKAQMNNNQNTEMQKNKSYECQECFKVFDKPKKLYLHKRTHNKTEVCPLDACNKFFATKSDLEKHFRTHTGEKPYECSICGQRFTQRASLKAHRINVHNDGFDCYR
ncbi:uncharacterized protein ACR2FA_002018 [Aphomia sociella]